MKTLVNKNNPAIRITAPEIELWIGSAFVIGQNLSGTTDNRGIALVVGRNGWILVREEETIVKTIKEFVEKGKRCEQQAVEDNDQENYIFWQGFQNCAENILREVEKPTEGIKGNLEEIPSNVDLEKESEDYANKEHPDEPSVGQFGTGDYEPFVDREYLREIAKDAFKKGAEWQKERYELTWKDLQKLDIIANELWQDGKYDKNDAQEFYTEVLKHFKEYKEQKNK